MRRLSLALPALALASCGHAENKAAGSGEAGSRSFALAGFDRVAVSGSDDVDVVVGKSFSVSATGPEAVLDQLEIVVEGGVLKIGQKSRSGWHIGWSHQDAKVTVTMPAIRGARLAGSGKMKVDRATADSLDVSLAGSGDLKINNIQANSVDLSLAGSGNIELAGRTGAIDISSAGSGNIMAGAIEAETANISLAGSGNISARATESAAVSIMGSGDIAISGTGNCKTSTRGSGSVTCKA